ncbi:sensor histidine kinase [Paenibacillus hamazuiensis]|uniref:sensor histidine kinase n=1 Tax=Paenibacillus hamazuiensis TaxID=2936508 RepID=UPI00200C01C7|nr:sensor histidine kinase [Paenibacillus hamazuiensis]
MRPFFRRSFRHLLMLAQGFAAARYWLLAYVLIILLPSLAVLYFYQQRTTAWLEEEVTRSMLQTIKQTGINLTGQLGRIQEISNALFMNPNLYAYIKAADSSDPLTNLKNFRPLIDSAQANDNIFRVRVFMDDSNLYSGEKINFFPLSSVLSRPWYARVVEAGGSIVWSGAYLEHYIDRDDTYVISSARMLRDPDNFDRMLGLLVIDVKEQAVLDIMTEVKLSGENRVYIVDADGTIVTHADRALIGQKGIAPGVEQTIRSTQEGIVKTMSGLDATYTIFTTIRSTGWKLLAEVPADDISRQALKLNRFSGAATLLGVSVLFLLLVFLLLAFIIRSMNRRVQLVIRAIRREGIEHLDERHAAADGGINVLERSVDHLIVKVREMMEEAYRSKMQEREAQLRALQAQINPHFLYNTLDTINWIAVGRGAHDISQMIDALAKYFRLSLNKGKDTVSVEDELNLAKVYLEIQLSRFPHSFEFTVEADPRVYAFFMPKLTLQPIVENALLHGIRKAKRKNGLIRIEARLDEQEQELVLSVADNGAGMDDETAARLLTEPQPSARSDGSGSSYGLFNVNERIKLFSGENGGVSVRSAPGEGTTVTVRLKATDKTPEAAG